MEILIFGGGFCIGILITNLAIALVLGLCRKSARPLASHEDYETEERSALYSVYDEKIAGDW